MLILRSSRQLFTALLSLLLGSAAQADSRLLATGGASTIDGAAGGGIVPWAVLAGYGSQAEWGATAFGTQVRFSDYSLDGKGVAISRGNRIELSYARQTFDLGTLGDALGMPGHRFRLDVYGAKFRLGGDLIYGALPQLSVGWQHKRHLDFGVPAAVGALRKQDDDFYVSAAKVWLAGVLDRNAFLNVNARYSRANQGGLLGFGGDLGDDREVLLEAAGGVFLHRRLAVGMEYRKHPDKISFSQQDAWRDVFAAYFPSKQLSLVAAYAELGTVATLADQRGWYLSLAFTY